MFLLCCCLSKYLFPLFVYSIITATTTAMTKLRYMKDGLSITVATQHAQYMVLGTRQAFGSRDSVSLRYRSGRLSAFYIAVYGVAGFQISVHKCHSLQLPRDEPHFCSSCFDPCESAQQQLFGSSSIYNFKFFCLLQIHRPQDPASFI